MRQLCVLSAILISTTLAACGGGDDNPAGDDVADPDGGLDQPDYGFQIVTPDIEVGAGIETTKCFYTTVDIDEDVGVKQWASEMTDGCHHLIVYFTDTAAAPDGTVDDCEAASGVPVWTYSAQTQEQHLDMPENVGMKVKAQQHLYVQMHFLNATLAPLDVSATINGNAYAPGVEYTPAAPYITYNTEIDLDPGETATFGGTCAVPDGVEFFTMSTHAHKRATHTQVQDGTPVVFESDDWEEPGATDWVDDNYTFSAGSLTYSCTYTNNETFHIGEGQSAKTDEMCMAVGYYFPAPNGPTYCLNSFVVPAGF